MRIDGVGPSPCDLMFCGEGPGYYESIRGIPFVGRTGEYLDSWLDGRRLPRRHDVFLTNIFRQFHGNDYEWTQADLHQDEQALLDELQRVKPTVIATLGRWSTRYFLGDVSMDSVWGIPWISKDNGYVIFPIHHPAAGMRNADLSPYVVEGFTRLSAYLQEDGGPRTGRIVGLDPISDPIYVELKTLKDLEDVLQDLGPQVHLDTEGWPEYPWSVQFSDTPGTGYLIRHTNRDLLARFSKWLQTARPRLTFHHALHDWQISRILGVNCADLPFDDTMAMGHLLQIEPKGLKDACLRHCGMPMVEFQDIMGDTENVIAREYLTSVWDVEQVEYQRQCQAEFDRRKTEVWTDARGRVHTGRRITKIPQLPKSPLLKAVTRVLSSETPYRLWQDQSPAIHMSSVLRCGPMPHVTLDHVPTSRSVPYGCRDADGTGRLLPIYRDLIEQRGLKPLYDLELSTYPLLNRMMQIGIKPDLACFKALSDRLESTLAAARMSLAFETGIVGFNANSGDQVADYLYGVKRLTPIKLTASTHRGSTNDKILEALEHQHPNVPVIGKIRRIREIGKLKGTFVDVIPDLVNRWPYDGRIHTTLKAASVITGRLSAADPNLLAQPEHGEFAKEFKRGWVADPGHVIYQADEAQIELRVLAHLSQDPYLIDAFRNGVDLHAALAHRIFGIPAEQQDKHTHRYPAKTIHYLMCMGGTAHGLMIQLRANGVMVDLDTAQTWLDETFDMYKEVPTYMRAKVREAEDCGYVRGISGRIRYIGGIESSDDQIRSEAKRLAFSTPIQEGAAYLMKQAEATVWTEVLPYFWTRGVWCEPLLQVHDNLKIEIDEGHEHTLHVLMRDAMVNVPNGLCVPLEIDAEVGPNFADTQSIGGHV